MGKTESKKLLELFNQIDDLKMEIRKKDEEIEWIRMNSQAITHFIKNDRFVCDSCLGKYDFSKYIGTSDGKGFCSVCFKGGFKSKIRSLLMKLNNKIK